MDNRRFDALVRSLATGANRRQLLRGMLGLGGGAIAAGTLFGGEVDAARRSANPTPTPVRCPGIQTPCESGCCCPDGSTNCGPDCCPGGSECCDSACCYGTCYDEERCCPTGNVVCDGQCVPGECCISSDCAPGHACFQGVCFQSCSQPALDCPCGDCVILGGTGLELCASVISELCQSNADCQQQHGAGWVCADTVQCLHPC